MMNGKSQIVFGMAIQSKKKLYKHLNYMGTEEPTKFGRKN